MIREEVTLFPPLAVQRRHSQPVRDSSSSHKIDYVEQVYVFSNPEGHKNCIVGKKKVTAMPKIGRFCLLVAYRNNYRLISFVVTNVINYVICENTMPIMLPVL